MAAFKSQEKMADEWPERKKCSEEDVGDGAELCW